jgi:hypothetical protein
MNGQTLLTAAEIMVKAGEQIEAMMEILGEKLMDISTNKENKIRVKELRGEEDYNGWLLSYWLKDYALLEGRKAIPYAHIAVKVVLYDDDEKQIEGWEPSLYVMCGEGRVPFDIDDVWLSEPLDHYSAIKNGDRLLKWEATEEVDAGWVFVVPLVRLNCEEDLVLQIVEPVKKLIDANKPAAAFLKDSVAFRFTQEGDKLRILVENP